MTQSAPVVQILYGTATGTAEDVSQELAELLMLRGVDIKVCCTIDDYNLANLPRDAAAGYYFLFIVSTCGDGEVPITMRKFWHFLRRSDLPSGVLAALRFAVFGLGDRAYVKFNAAARKLALRLSDLGASPIAPLRLGDESAQGGFDKELFPWIEQVFNVIAPELSPSDTASEIPLRKEPRIIAKLSKSTPAQEAESYAHDLWHLGQARRQLSKDRDVLFDAKVLQNDIITNSNFLTDNKEVRHIRLDVTGAPEATALRNYIPGDIVHIMPRNRESTVDAFFILTGFDSLATIHIQDAHSKTRFGSYQLHINLPCTLREFVSAQLDLNCTPRRRFFERLAPFATDAMQKEKLLEFASQEGAEILTQYAYREKRTILMVLRDFPSARPPLSDLIDMIPTLKSRAFSIASSTKAHPNEIHVCASIVQYTTPLRFSRIGVCSSFFMRLKVGDIVPVFLERGTSLRFSEDKPCIMVGPGTGVAPMRSFLSSSQAGPERVLFFGCRSKNGDFLYQADWNTFRENGQLTELIVAFSREQDKKVYVQDRLVKAGDMVWNLISEQHANVYIAGAAGGMPKGVRQAFVQMCQDKGGLDEKQAEAYVRRMEMLGRLQMECW